MNKQGPISALFLSLLIAGFLGQACNPQTIELDLPEYENKLVVESYLLDNKRITLTLTESQSYFAEPTLPLITDALVTLSYNGIVDTLAYRPDKFDYRGKKVQRIPGIPYNLRVEDTFGRVVTATTQFEDIVPIDTLNVTNDGAGEWRVIVDWQDVPAQTNYYRITMRSDSGKKWDRYLSDQLSPGEAMSFSSSYRFRPNVDVRVDLYHISGEYFKFLTSLSQARRAAGSPIAEPAPVNSNIEGGLGIFTALSKSRKTVRTGN